MAEKKKGDLPRSQVFGYVMGSLPLALIAGFFNLAYVNYFYDDLKLNEGFWILGLVIYSIVNAINDPLIGHKSDNTNVKKWGSRRIVFIKFFSPALIIVFVLMWFPWSLDNQIVIFLHFVIMICAYDICLTTVTMTWYALLPDMTADIGERAKIGFISGLVGFFGGLGIMFVPYIMNDRELLQIGAIIIAIVSMIGYAIVVKFSRESPEFQSDKSPPLIESLKQSLKSRSFKCFMGYNFAVSLQASVGLSYLFVHALILGENGILYFFLIYVLIGFSSNVICMKLRPKYGIKKIMKTFMPLQIIGGIAFFFMVLNPTTEWLIWFSIVWTAFFGGSTVFTPVLQTLPIDEDELNYGSRREGMFFGVNALFTMHAYSIGPIIATVVLALTNYVKDAPRIIQPTSAIIGIKALFLIAPQIFTLIALVFVILYPMEKLESVSFQEELAKLHKKKKEKLAQ